MASRIITSNEKVLVEQIPDNLPVGTPIVINGERYVIERVDSYRFVEIPHVGTKGMYFLVAKPQPAKPAGRVAG